MHEYKQASYLPLDDHADARDGLVKEGARLGTLPLVHARTDVQTDDQRLLQRSHYIR